jgi:hypothetical protein
LSSEFQDIFLLSQIVYENVNERVKNDKSSSGAIYFLQIVWHPMALVFTAGGAASGAVYCKNVNIYRPVRCKATCLENCQFKEVFSFSLFLGWLNRYLSVVGVIIFGVYAPRKKQWF